MDETDLSLFGNKKKSKHDKADAHRGIPTEAVQKNTEKPIIISRPTDEDTYNCNNPNIGIAVVFNHKIVKGQKQRTGTEVDRDSIEHSLEQYGFDVRVYDDLSFADINDKLKEVANEDHSLNDCFIVVVMSHGLEGKVYASDMPYPVERLWTPFLGSNCQTLINKPKIFFIQACRGENLDKPVVYSEFATMSRSLSRSMSVEEKPPVINYAIPNTADILVMYSTFEKHYSFRNVENGSWFIQSVCAVFNEMAQKDANTNEGAELLRLLTTVNRRVAYEYQSFANTEAINQMKEMPNFLSTLTKLFYLKVKRKN